MEALDRYILTIITFLPTAGALLVLAMPRGRDNAYRWLALAFSLATFALSLLLWTGFDTASTGVQFELRLRWIPALGIHYYMGVDGISLLLVLLTTFLATISVLASWRGITERVKAFMAAMLVLETGMIGVFVSLDLILFFVFWEAMLIPMYLLIGVWGHERRIYATVKFILYTMFGSALMLVAILGLYFYHRATTGTGTFDLLALRSQHIAYTLQIWFFLAFALAFAIKVPLFPFHTGLPDAHVEAPTAGSVLLAGVLLKMGTYGFVRFCLPLFPEAALLFMPYLAVLAVIGIIYGALVALVQPDVKKLIAYSSVSHLGFVVLGIFAFNVQGLQGAMIQMVNHGLSTGALFLIAGMLYERRHTRLITEFGGLWKQMPLFAAFFMIVVLSSLGLPGLNGFVGEFLVLVGAFLHASEGGGAHYALPVLAAFGVVLAAVYLLWMFRRVMHGELTKEENRRLHDLSVREALVLLPIVLLIFAIGLYPKPFLERTEASVQAAVTEVRERGALAGQEVPAPTPAEWPGGVVPPGAVGAERPPTSSSPGVR
ncbi:MAG: NADH-quinone oxidoreductase subunit M [Armatimonadota bacterium]